MSALAATDDLIDQLHTYYRRLQQANANLRAWHQRYLEDLQVQQRARLDDLQRAATSAHAVAEARHQVAFAAADAAFDRSVRQTSMDWAVQTAQLAPGFGRVIAPWDDPIWQQYAPEAGGSLPAGVRIGALLPAGQAGDYALPAVAPLIGHRHLWIVHGEVTRSAAHALLQGLLLRLALTFPRGRMLRRGRRCRVDGHVAGLLYTGRCLALC